MTADAWRIVIIQGHPDPAGGHFCHALAQAYKAGATAAGHEMNTLRMPGFKPVRETLIGNVEAADGRGRERWLRALGEPGRAGC